MGEMILKVRCNDCEKGLLLKERLLECPECKALYRYIG